MDKYFLLCLTYDFIQTSWKSNENFYITQKNVAV